MNAINRAPSQIVVSLSTFKLQDELTPQQKFPNNHVCNVQPDQQQLMRRAARKLGYAITFGLARNALYSDSLGVYVPNLDRDPQYLVRYFQALKVDAYLAAKRRSKKR